MNLDEKLDATYLGRQALNVAERRAFRAGWMTNAAHGNQPDDYLNKCEEVDWLEYQKRGHSEYMRMLPPAPPSPRRLCDCERGHNGMGMAGRECDCPTVEDGWTEEQHQAALSYLSPPSLASRVALLGQGACDCNTKSPDVHMHLPTCRYRQVMELADAVEELET